MLHAILIMTVTGMLLCAAVAAILEIEARRTLHR